MFEIKNDTITFTTEKNLNCFGTQAQFSIVADRLMLTRERLETIWNNMAGAPPFEELKPVVKFRNRPYGIERLWSVIQRLVPKVEKTVRGDSKSSTAIAMMSTPPGATAQQLQDALGWQAHTLRGWVSTQNSKYMRGITSEKIGEDRVYRIA